MAQQAKPKPNLHDTTDAVEWERQFMETFPNCGISEGTMTGWFANAMMAKSDEIDRRVDAEADTAEEQGE